MNYPLEKYHYYTYRRADGAMVVKAVSTYAGVNIFGKAICHPNATFDLEKGKELAAARCNEKVAEKRLRRAQKKRDEAADIYYRAMHKYSDMVAYENDAIEEKIAAREKVGELLGNF